MQREHIIENGDIVKHFKGGEYEVIDINVKCCDTANRKVLYKDLANNKMYVRDYESFIDTVGPHSHPGLKDIKFRFTVIAKFGQRTIKPDYESMYKHLEEQCVTLHNDKEELKQCVKHLALSINAIIR